MVYPELALDHKWASPASSLEFLQRILLTGNLLTGSLLTGFLQRNLLAGKSKTKFTKDVGDFQERNFHFIEIFNNIFYLFILIFLPVVK